MNKYCFSEQKTAQPFLYPDLVARNDDIDNAHPTA